MSMIRGHRGFPVALSSLLAVVAAVACGGSGDDDTGSNGSAAASGTKASGGSSGTDASGGTTDTGGSSGSAAKGGSDSSTGGTSGTTSGSAGKGGSSGTSTGKGGTSTGKGGTSGSAGTATADLLDGIGDACETDCDAQYALDCAPANGNTLTCQLSCAAQTTQLGDFCLAEYRDYVACRAEGGYDCVSSNPYPRSTCAVQQLAFSDCTKHIGCKRYCQRVADLGCNDTPFDECEAACEAVDESLPEDCYYSTETIAYCQVSASAMCEDDHLAVPAACSSSVITVAECFSDSTDDLCDGWCWASDRLGCGSEDCKADCTAKKSPAECGSQWDSLLDCVLFFDDGECKDGALAGNGICDSEQSAYQSCIAGDGGVN
ncbi:MAG TPA: hypothetical protein VNN72_19260 [Polyangiaceae bacterium]|nr:hypothetical protein [Polyangiaceae bacterium]